MAKLGKRSRFIATVYDAGENSIDVDLLAPVEEIICEVVSILGENYQVGQVTNFGNINCNNWTLQELSLVANFASLYPKTEYALLILEVVSPLDCWDLINWVYCGQFSCREDIAKEILKGRFGATERLIDCVDLEKYLQRLEEDGGLVLVQKESFLHAFCYCNPFSW